MAHENVGLLIAALEPYSGKVYQSTFDSEAEEEIGRRYCKSQTLLDGDQDENLWMTSLHPHQLVQLCIPGKSSQQLSREYLQQAICVSGLSGSDSRNPVVIWQARVALLPFFVGAVIAYILLPLVNSHGPGDAALPGCADRLALLLGGLALIFYLLIPPLVTQTPTS